MSKALDPTGRAFSGSKDTMVGNITGPGKPDSQTSATLGAKTEDISADQSAD